MASFFRVAIAFVLACCVSQAWSVAQTPQDLERKVDQIFVGYNQPSTPGCMLGVVRDGRFIYKRGYGMASLELGVPVTPQSVFYIGSVSKQFTAASVVLAAEQHYLSLDDGVRKYIPELPSYASSITLRQMLHHTSGFSDILGMLWVSGRNEENLHPAEELMALIRSQRTPNFKPGEEYMYSNTNYFLLAEVIKRATKKPLSEFAAENIFKPLGMTHTRFYDDHNVVVTGRASAYKSGKNGEFLVGWSTEYDMVGAGGVMSTIDDLLLWDHNFYENKLGKGTLLNEMQTVGVLNNGMHTNYGLGLFITTYRGLPIVEHGGELFSYHSDILRFPQKRFTVIALCNASSVDPERLSRNVADIYLEHDLQPAPLSLRTFAADPNVYAGRYFDSHRHFVATFTVKDGNLVLQGDFLRRVESNKFEDPLNGGIVTFSTSSDGAKATIVYNNTTTFAGTRINDVHFDDTVLAAYTGKYRNAELDATYSISVERGSLTLRMNWNPAITLQPVVENEFFAGVLSLVFQRDAATRVSGLHVFAGWNNVIRELSFEKVQ